MVMKYSGEALANPLKRRIPKIHNFDTLIRDMAMHFPSIKVRIGTGSIERYGFCAR